MTELDVSHELIGHDHWRVIDVIAWLTADHGHGPYELVGQIKRRPDGSWSWSMTTRLPYPPPMGREPSRLWAIKALLEGMEATAWLARDMTTKALQEADDPKRLKYRLIMLAREIEIMTFTPSSHLEDMVQLWKLYQ